MHWGSDASAGTTGYGRSAFFCVSVIRADDTIVARFSKRPVPLPAS